ncbi:MAG: tRNA CCA-pyrophosphorylase [Proteobacteria bacterium]|nr:tRNA CCA-pyrophosphorylase [Pseudomonadota bacterium]MBU1741402.1 tRNA CCA-pyrophosphorylase [Pseudomonadota bacterium]
MSQGDICGLSPEDFFIRMEEFHGARSPGILVGGLMIDTALGELGSCPYVNVVTETVVCLPDAVQLLTPCTIGNGFLQVLDWGKFALTAYDRQSLAGVRVALDPDAVGNYPLIRRWFERSPRGGDKPAFDQLAPEIIAAGRAILAWRPVRLHRALKESSRVPTGRCPKCGESYALRLGPTCPACQGEAYYV